MMKTVSFFPSAPAVTASNAGAAGMTGECCQIPWCVTRSSRRISRTPLSCLPLILPLPIIVNQSANVSMGFAVRRTIVRAVGCGEKCAASLPASQYTSTGSTRDPSPESAWARCPKYKWDLLALQHRVHMAVKQRDRWNLSTTGAAKAENIVSQGCQQESNAAPSDVTALLEKWHNNNDRTNGTEVKHCSEG